MPMQIDATVSGAMSNSYCDVAFADDYFASHMNSVKRDSWAALSVAQKTMALIQACAMLERLKMTEPLVDADYPSLLQRMTWGSVTAFRAESTRWPATFVQKLQLPRNIDVQADLKTFYIPEQAKDAQCEQALFMVNADDSDLVTQQQGISQQIITADSVRVATKFTGNGNLYAPFAIALIGGLMIRGSRRMQRS